MNIDKAEQELLQYPHAVGVGFGWKEVRGEATTIPALRVYVREKVPRAYLHPADMIPRQIDGLATDVLTVAIAAPISRGDVMNQPLLTAGVAVSNLQAVLGQPATCPADAGLGTLGFFAATNGTTERLEVVLVSNRHVLLAHGAQQGDLIYAPVFTRQDGSYIFRQAELHPIAEIMDEGMEGNYPYCYPGEASQEYFIDCATARILTERGLHPQPALMHMERLRMVLLKGIARVHELDVMAGRTFRVSKLGATTSQTFGRVVDVMAPVMLQDGSVRQNNLMIRGEIGQGGGASSFAEDGDSGAMIVDERNRAVGLLWGKSQRNKLDAFACHIHPVLDRLNVTPLTYDPFLLQG